MPKHSPRLTVAVVTGTRAEFGLLRPVMDAIALHPRLRLKVIAAGSHLLPPARTIREVRAGYPIAATVPMQKPGEARTRHADALAVARGIDGFARAFAKMAPDWVVVLGDRIEAFAAASAASIAGIAVAHIHGGDRAEGIADEAMRHAISKLSHLHCAATQRSGKRIVRMGERPEYVHVTGSPAIDGLARIKPMGDREAARLGDPGLVVLLHPSGLPNHVEASLANELANWSRILDGTLFLAPNHDSGREVILETWRRYSAAFEHVRFVEHLPRESFVALLKRFTRPAPFAPVRGVLVGNSSAGLVEACALGVPTINIGPRQDGREHGPNVQHLRVDPANFDPCRWGERYHAAWWRSFERAQEASDLFGDGRSGARIAALLARTDPHAASLLRKRNSY